MSGKNKNWKILDKILEDAAHPDRKNGMTPEEVAEGLWVTDRETFDELYKNVNKVERQLQQ